MGEYNRYINNFVDVAEYDNYMESSIAKVPNTALIDGTGEVKMTKRLPDVMLGTTTGTQDFMIGQSFSESGSPDCIKIHVVVEDDSWFKKMYVAAEDVLKTPKYFYSSYNGFGTTEGKKIATITKWKIDTSNATSMAQMFYYCSYLDSVDVSNFNTSNVTDMSGMFYYCSRLTSLDVSNFNTSKVTNVDFMFYGCQSLTSLDLSNFNTSNVTDMSGMFYGCQSLTSLDLSNFDTSNVTNMASMFQYCRNLTSLDLSNFNTSKVTNVDFMFYDCQSLTSLDLRNFNTSKITSIRLMFYNCTNLKKLYLSASFFNSWPIKTFDLELVNWTDTESLAKFVEVLAGNYGNYKTIKLSIYTKNALTSAQKTAITNNNWIIS